MDSDLAVLNLSCLMFIPWSSAVDSGKYPFGVQAGLGWTSRFHSMAGLSLEIFFQENQLHERGSLTRETGRGLFI